MTPVAIGKPADTCAGYIERHKPYLAYHTYLAAGFPIATGVIEGACRYLLRDRMEITGARWSLAGAEAILRLRSLRASGDWDAYWPYHEQQERQRHHATRYAKGQIPTLIGPGRPSRRPFKSPPLRVVKS